MKESTGRLKTRKIRGVISATGGDHQIIYLLKLLEHSHAFHPRRLTHLLRDPVFCYANVPYRIRPFEQLLADSKNTVDYDEDLATRIEDLTRSIGADGKLVLDNNDEVYQVNLTEKLLVPLLSKLGNLVIDGGHLDEHSAARMERCQ